MKKGKYLPWCSSESHVSVAAEKPVTDEPNFYLRCRGFFRKHFPSFLLSNARALLFSSAYQSSALLCLSSVWFLSTDCQLIPGVRLILKAKPTKWSQLSQMQIPDVSQNIDWKHFLHVFLPGVLMRLLWRGISLLYVRSNTLGVVLFHEYKPHRAAWQWYGGVSWFYNNITLFHDSVCII